MSANVRKAVWAGLAVAAIGLGLVVAILAAHSRDRAVTRNTSASKPSATAPAELPPSPPAPLRGRLYSETRFDDSGSPVALTFANLRVNHRSLEDSEVERATRAVRGLTQLRESLNRLPAGDANSGAAARSLRLQIASLLMFEGRFAEADRELAAIQESLSDPDDPEQINLEALRGIAALRRGETENCVACQTEASCIFPLAADAVHRKKDGSREAIRHFTAYLKRRPEDLGVRWLLNVAAMTLGEYPDGVPSEYRITLDRFGSQTDIGKFVNVSDRVGLDLQGPRMAGGSVFDDFNNDGLLDLFMSTEDPNEGASLFVNRGDGTFVDRSQEAGLATQVGSLNLKGTDYDNDGRLDVLILRGAWELPQRLSLLHNNGDGTFTDVTLKARLGEPIASATSAWADYDNDGFLDLFIAGEYRTMVETQGRDNRPDPRNRSRLYHNNGDGTFTDVAKAAGVLNEAFGKGAAWGDYDNDGRPDLYVSNMGQPNRLYHNNGDGTFTDVAEKLGVTKPLFGFACWFWDYDNDGRLDLYVNGYNADLQNTIASLIGQKFEGETPRLYHNEGSAGFRDVTAEAGLDRILMAMGCNFGDIDNDGYLDFYLGTGGTAYTTLYPNLMFRNVGGRRFEDVTISTGTGHLQKGHGASFGDWDGDGDLDLFIRAGGATPGDKANCVLFQNPGHGNHWLGIKLIGTKTNRAAVGASVRVELEGPEGTPASLYRVVSCGSNWGGNGFPMTIGLGKATKIAKLEVSWPTSKTRQTFRDVPLDRALTITEGEDHFRVLDRKPIPLPAAPKGKAATQVSSTP